MLEVIHHGESINFEIPWKPERKSPARLGDVFGTRTLVEWLGKNGHSRRWRWKCECGNQGMSDISNIVGSENCVKCQSRTTRSHVYFAGSVVGIFKVLEKHGPARRRKYTVQCLRCGETKTRPINYAKMSKTTRCGNCKHKYYVFGKCMTLKEMSEAFGVSQTLLNSRIFGKHYKDITLEQVLFAPRQKRFQ